jgi:5-methylcytosine-specific restriction endonuclease McrA
MIHVDLADEPPNFDQRVRQPGLRAIAELIGEQVLPPRRGPKRAAVATRREDIPSDKFPPYWREALPDMLTSYNRLCAYLSLYIEHATANPSVDHVVPKSRAWQQIYEWSNYRLAAAKINSKKSNLHLLLDPFAIPDGLFALEFVAFQVKPGPAAGGLEAQVMDTINVLGLNDQECCDAREAYFNCYNEGKIRLDHLEERAPFVAREMRRQRRLRPGDR